MKKTFIYLFSFIVFIILSITTVYAETSEKTFVLHISDELPLIHPQASNNVVSAQLLTGLCKGLFIYDPYTCRPISALAESWTENKNTWKFEIRKNARFENGDKITAHTVKNSWLNLLNPKFDYPYASMLDCVKGVRDYRLGKTKNQNAIAITVEDDFTLIVSLENPTPYFAKILCHHAFSVLHPSQFANAQKYIGNYVLEDDENGFIPISSGPFKVETYTKELIKFVKNPTYWDEESVELDTILIKMNMNADDLADSFNRGEIHWTNNSVNIDKIVGYNTIQYTPIFSTEYIFFNVKEKPLDNPKFRKALLLAIPYETLRENYFIPAKTFVFPLIGYPTVDGIEEYNPSDAKSMIAGLKLSEKEKIIKLKLPNTNYHKKILSVLKKAWTSIGLKVEVIFLNYTEYYSSLKNDDYNLGTMTWIGDFADPIAFLELFRMNSSLNDSKWKNKEYEDLIIKANSESEQKERYKLLSEAEQFLLDNSVVIPISHSPSVNIIDLSNISGWYSNPLNIHPFKFIKFIPSKMLPGIVKL